MDWNEATIVELLNRPLEDYLQHKFGPTVVLEKATRFPRGSSRLTWFVDYRSEVDSPIKSLVFRGESAGGATIHTSLEQEYFMYDRLGQTDVPVARTLWWESDGDWAPRPFYVREQVDGDWNVPHFADPDPKYDQLRIETSKEHMRKLALVHNVDWRKHGFDERLPVPASVETCARTFLDGLVERLEDYRREPMPVVVEALVELRRDAPVAPRICLCKGTNGLGEEVFKDGVIVAMSDWEEASIGDPAADFASLQDFLPEIDRDGTNLWGLEKALAYYREVSGIPLTLENVRYYQALRSFGAVLYGHKAAVITHHGNTDIRKPWTGTEVLYVAKRLLAAATGLCDPLRTDWFAELNETVK
jgi:aminoglycoside phosphotransferase (APT) family kinase protein